MCYSHQQQQQRQQHNEAAAGSDHERRPSGISMRCDAMPTSNYAKALRHTPSRWKSLSLLVECAVPILVHTHRRNHALITAPHTHTYMRVAVAVWSSTHSVHFTGCSHLCTVHSIAANVVRYSACVRTCVSVRSSVRVRRRRIIVA